MHSPHNGHADLTLIICIVQVLIDSSEDGKGVSSVTTPVFVAYFGRALTTKNPLSVRCPLTVPRSNALHVFFIPRRFCIALKICTCVSAVVHNFWIKESGCGVQ